MYYYPPLRDLREDKDFNQTEIAKLLSTTTQNYGRYEMGQRELPLHHLIKLADLYKISTDYILGCTDEMKSYPHKIVR